MAKLAKQQQGRSLWGRMLGRAPSAAAKPVRPLAVLPTHRPLTVRDKLWTVDGQGQRVYVPLTVDGLTGRWAGREWQHCGEREGVLIVRWADRDNGAASLHWASLASELVSIVEGGTAA